MVFDGCRKGPSCCLVSFRAAVRLQLRLFSLFTHQSFNASYMLGDCLLDGEGVEMDRGAALEWLIRSADLGHR